jgi:hypothetical protein
MKNATTYTLSIILGRDEASRHTVSKHRSIRAAVCALDRGGWGEGWQASVRSSTGRTLDGDDLEMVRMCERARVAS